MGFGVSARDMRAPVVAVFGATGHTGRFVVNELLRVDIAPVAVARDPGKLAAAFAQQGVPTRTASIDDPVSLDRAFANVLVVVNCAGPFLDTAVAVGDAALRANAHYMDMTAEQASARSTLERLDGPARVAGRIVIPAMGFYGGFADLLATVAMGSWGSADEIRIGISLDQWHPTRGTRRTGERNTGPRAVITGGKLTPMPQPAPEAVWDFPEPFGRQEMIEVPLSEIILIGHHLSVSELHTFLNRAPLRDLHDPATPPPVAVDEAGRSGQIFMVDVIARRDAETRRATANGRDIYAFTAPLVGEAVRRILAGETSQSGAHAPGAIMEARSFLDALTPHSLSLTVRGA